MPYTRKKKATGALYRKGLDCTYETHFLLNTAHKPHIYAPHIPALYQEYLDHNARRMAETK